MIGNVIYLIFCRDMVHHSDTMETPRATFDGTLEHMNQIKKHFLDKNFEVKEVPDGSFYVYGPFGFQRLYYVVTRTIEK